MAVSPMNSLLRSFRSPRMQAADHAIGLSFLGSAICAFLIWYHSSAHEWLALGIFIAPLALSAILLYPIFLVVPSTFPKPTIKGISSLTTPIIHIAVVMTTATLLSSPINAGVEPFPQQQLFAVWLHPAALLGAMVSEWIVFGIFALKPSRKATTDQESELS